MPRFLPGSLLTAGALLAAAPAPPVNQVANYHYGQPGTASYEHVSLWSHEGQRYNMQYSYGTRRTDVPAHYVGPARVSGQSGFRMKLDDGRVLTLMPSGTALRVSSSAAGVAPKVFRWEYEGPVNGVGTFCSVCAPDSAAAMQLVQHYYVR